MFRAAVHPMSWDQWLDCCKTGVPRSHRLRQRLLTTGQGEPKSDRKRPKLQGSNTHLYILKTPKSTNALKQWQSGGAMWHVITKLCEVIGWQTSSSWNLNGPRKGGVIGSKIASLVKTCRRQTSMTQGLEMSWNKGWKNNNYSIKLECLYMDKWCLIWQNWKKVPIWTI